VAAPKGNKNAVGNKGGRPTLYKPEYCEKVINWGKQGKSRAWMAAELDVARDTLNEWTKAHEEFADALSRAKTHEQRWWEDAGQEGLTSDRFNGAMWAKNMASRFHDEWRDNSKTTIEGGDPNAPIRHHLSGVRWMTEEEAKARGWA
jgi:transposase